MQAVVRTATLVGVEAVPVEVQADVASGLPSFCVVGLADAAVLEARDRVRSALRASGYDFPSGRVVVNLAPAPLRKHGTGFDLPIALSLLSATGQIPRDATSGMLAVGELSLGGEVRPIGGMLAFALAACRDGAALLGPPHLALLSAGVPGLRHLVVRRLRDLTAGPAEECPVPQPSPQPTRTLPDLADVVGQEAAKRALEIAAAGGHNLLFVGPPGSGKTMLARRLPGILPPLTAEERLSTALVHSVAGLDEREALAGVRPFRAPHHTCSSAGLVGGAAPPRPGEASLAHNGVLFLDEFAEFGPAALQALRQPLEDGVLTLVRAEGRVTYPARFTLVAAMNPCPCGYLGDPVKRCRCSEPRLDRYFSRIGGPLMDRVDVCVRVDRIDPASLVSRSGLTGGTSAMVGMRVLAARETAMRRQAPCNAALAGDGLTDACALDAPTRRWLTDAARSLHLSGRAVTRVLRVSRTIADLEGSERVRADHVAEAVAYRHVAGT